ncbi:hypothetical protein [Tenacibaculum finnmarkense]|uniref:hypothetical protein n=1 Tax=Tenacibaculum finnmarkense TaxID=2781243 RepID=UPI001EFC1A15|nr:hypothetical protein [Tenacibaculum finnmarkense]MCG8729627.1 hypothetical protein [Tenacibaculum finnmarkense]MCG8747992.1 hypothetical protein [Tenacibaculum finnmarkense]MCG8760855.1 hypothetical protein [Tenacibaculum finnmarkense]
MSDKSQRNLKKIISTTVLSLLFIICVIFESYIFGGIIVFFILINLSFKDNSKKDEDDYTNWHEVNQANKIARQFKNGQIESLIMKLIESHYIIQSTKNFETFKSRYNLFYDKLNEILPIKEGWRFKDAFNDTATKYKLMYHNRNTIAIQKDLENFNESDFFEKHFFNCANLYVLEQNSKIEALKTEKAKQNRKDKLNSKIDEFLAYLSDSFGYSDNDLFFEKIENLKQ